MAFVSYRILKKDIQFDFSIKNLRHDFKTHFKFAQPALYANLLSELSAYIDIFIINYLIKDLFEIGQYSFALTLTVALRIFPATVQQIASPYFSSLSVDIKAFKEIFKRYNRQLTIGVIATLIISIVLISPVLHFIFDTKYQDAISLFYLLSIGWSIRQLTQLQSAAIFGLGKIKYNVYVSAISLAFNILIYSFATLKFGIIGAAYSSIASGIIIYVLSIFFFHKALRNK
jgi:O-antigen/teichoic acid export membrane protein